MLPKPEGPDLVDQVIRKCYEYAHLVTYSVALGLRCCGTDAVPLASCPALGDDDGDGGTICTQGVPLSPEDV